MMTRQILIACLMCVTAQALASSDDRFIKKYAMMKIYESCFGAEVVKQIRKEMKDAYTKCSAPPLPPPRPPSFDDSSNSLPSMLLSKLPPGFSLDPATQTITKPLDGANHNPENDFRKDNSQQRPQMGGVMNFRPQAFPTPQPALPPYMMPSSPQFRPFSQAAPFYQVPYAAPGLFNPYAYNPYAYQQQYPQGGFYQPPAPPAPSPYYGNSRMSRDMDLRDQLYSVSRGPPAGGNLRNITCVMQELGYVDHNLEPNYEQITQRISNLPVSSELKGDIQDGLQFCQKFSQCVPDVKRDVSPISQELIKPMFFFRCYKHKKLEACIMKDIRERFTSEDELDTDSDFRSLSRSARSARDDPLPDPRFEALDEMAVYLYDFLSGGNGFDFDMYM